MSRVQLILDLIAAEEERRSKQLSLIASENICSPAVRTALGSCLTDKYAEGYPGKRYYGGCAIVDQIESQAIQLVCDLFKCQYANVQPVSGTQANLAVYDALLVPGDTILSLSLDCGGHLSHGHKLSHPSREFKIVHYGLDSNNDINYLQLEQLAKEHKPKLIVAGISCFSGTLQWSRFAEISQQVEAYFLADIAHVSGLIAGGVYPSPIPYADVVTSTTHKTLRGPRGGLILAKSNKLASKLNRAVFPGTQGGPMMHAIAGKAIAFAEALHPSFESYQKQIIANTRAMSQVFIESGFKLIGPSFDNHMLLIDLTSTGLNGYQAQEILQSCNLVVNKNAIPSDPLGAAITSGIRIGTSSITTRGMKEKAAADLAKLIVSILHNKDLLNCTKAINELAIAYPIPVLPYDSIN